MEKNQIFEKSQLLKKLTSSERAEYLNLAGIRNYPKNTFIYWQNESANYFYVILKGLVKEYRVFHNNRSKTNGIRAEGDITSLVSLALPDKYLATAQALADTTVLAAPTLQFLDIVSKNADFMKSLREDVCSRLDGFLNETGNIIFKNMQGNLASKLIDLSKRFGIKKENGILINLTFSQQELAEMLATNRETVCKILQQFKEEKSIIIKNKMIIISNIEKLKQWQ